MPSISAQQTDLDGAWPDGWAALYDEMDIDRARHVAFYAGLVSPDVNSLLDLGCGTGSISMAMSDRMVPGSQVVGVDLSTRMIDIARARAPQHEWRVGDMSQPPIEGQFDLIVCCFHTLQALLNDSDLLRCFVSVASHLAQDGRFAFDIYQPNLGFLAKVDAAPTIVRQFTDATGRMLHVVEHGSGYDPETRVLTGSWTLHDSNSGDALPLEPIVQRLRQYFPQDIARLLADAGLVALEHFGDLARGPATPDSKLQVYICGKA